MTVFWGFLIASIVSVGAIFLLRSTDDKRRRVFLGDRESSAPAVKAMGWAGVFVPGLILFGLQQYSAFLSWFGLITVAGWLIAARTPQSKT